jgi:hypothetical protein
MPGLPVWLASVQVSEARGDSPRDSDEDASLAILRTLCHPAATCHSHCHMFRNPTGAAAAFITIKLSAVALMLVTKLCQGNEALFGGWVLKFLVPSRDTDYHCSLDLDLKLSLD